MKTKQKMLTKPITAGFASIFYFKSVKDGIITGNISLSIGKPVLFFLLIFRSNLGSLFLLGCYLG